MPIAVEMPKMTDTMEEGVLVEWNVEEGTTISAGDIIAQVETDKATMDVEAYDDGVVLRRVASEGDALPIGALIAVLGKSGEDVDSFLKQYHVGGGKAEQSVATTAEPEPAPAAAPAAPSSEGERLKASPLARRMAQENGLNLGDLTGSGPEGRIIKRDIEAALAAPTPVVAPIEIPKPARSYESVRISSMRKVIARRLAKSKYSAPHFYLTVDVDMEQVIAARKRLNQHAERSGGRKISFNDLITKACGASLALHPDINSTYAADDNEIRRYQYIDIGIAVALDEGLVTPVVRDVDKKGLGQIAEETARLAKRARDRKLTPEEMDGSTFTTSNLGMFGVEEFTAIINPPNACILAIGAIRDVPVVKGGQVVPGKRMKLTLSSDHRVVDGASAARFMVTLRNYLEEPLSLLM